MFRVGDQRPSGRFGDHSCRTSWHLVASSGCRDPVPAVARVMQLGRTHAAASPDQAHHPSARTVVSAIGSRFSSIRRYTPGRNLRRNALHASSTSVNTTGMTIRVKSVERSRPPITAIAMGERVSEPWLSASAVGSMPPTMAHVVIRIGRSRVGPASRSASCRLLPRVISVLV